MKSEGKQACEVMEVVSMWLFSAKFGETVLAGTFFRETG